MSKMRIAVVLSAAVAVGTAGGVTAQNPVANPGFERGLQGWDTRADGDTGNVTVVDGGATGKQCALIDKVGSTEQWTAVGIVQEVAVEPNALYRLSLRSRTDIQENAVSYAFRAFISSPDAPEKDANRVIPASDDWAAFQWEHSTGPTVERITVSILLTYSSGKVWIDDVQLEKRGQSIEAESFPDATSAR
ncbi:MAG: carbohydrate binding domain-containing protein, partial [Armatimonadota bacterium]